MRINSHRWIAASGFVAALGMVAGLAGCTTSTTSGPVGPERARATTQGLNLSGFPPEYRRGYTDGCAVVGVNPKPARPAGEQQFQQGWADGFSYCAKRRNTTD